MFLLGGGENRRTSLCKLSYLPLPLHELLFFDYKEPNIHGNHFKIQLQILGLGLVLQVALQHMILLSQYPGLTGWNIIRLNQNGQDFDFYIVPLPGRVLTWQTGTRSFIY